MAKALDVLKHVSDFVEFRESLGALEDWSASYLHDVCLQGDKQDQNAIRAVRAALSAFENDSELVLRKEPAAIRYSSSLFDRAFLPR